MNVGRGAHDGLRKGQGVKGFSEGCLESISVCFCCRRGGVPDEDDCGSRLYESETVVFLGQVATQRSGLCCFLLFFSVGSINHFLIRRLFSSTRQNPPDHTCRTLQRCSPPSLARPPGCVMTLPVPSLPCRVGACKKSRRRTVCGLWVLLKSYATLSHTQLCCVLALAHPAALGGYLIIPQRPLVLGRSTRVFGEAAPARE